MTGAYRLLPQIKQDQSAEIECRPRETGTMTIWFRILDKAGMEFIASFSNGVKKDTDGRPSSTFSFSKIYKNIVILQSFDRNKDSGLYGCASLVKGKELAFGEVTKLVGGEFCFMNLSWWWHESQPVFLLYSDKVEDKPTIAPTTPEQNGDTTATACACVMGKCSSSQQRHVLFILLMLWGESGAKWTHALQGKPARCRSAHPSFCFHSLAVLAFFFYSSSSPSCTATVSALRSRSHFEYAAILLCERRCVVLNYANCVWWSKFFVFLPVEIRTRRCPHHYKRK